MLADASVKAPPKPKILWRVRFLSTLIDLDFISESCINSLSGISFILALDSFEVK